MCKVIRVEYGELFVTVLEESGRSRPVNAGWDAVDAFNRYVADHPGEPLAPLPAVLEQNLQLSEEAALKGESIMGVMIPAHRIQHEVGCLGRKGGGPCPNGYDMITLPC